MGFGVNSIALYLLMVELGILFEPVFSDTGCEWPDTYRYAAMFQWWTKANGLRSVTILKPIVQGEFGLMAHAEKYAMVPSFLHRWCTDKFKRCPLQKYQKKPAFIHIGFALDEAHRARISNQDGLENRYLLIEHEITRAGCIDMIRKAGLPIPRKSGCYICPFQRVGQWKELRRHHPELFCRALELEKANIAQRIARGKKPLYLSQSPRAPLSEIVGERQGVLFEQDEYPPCLCGL
jgi:3'-phosphoadenosine 5'-phosphosulfate sulfotransferase (PAPS reductase)/FAD synthetase